MVGIGHYVNMECHNVEECRDETSKGETAKLEGQCVTLEQSYIKKKNLEQRVVVLEASLSAAIGGIPHILAKLREIKNMSVGIPGPIRQMTRGCTIWSRAMKEEGPLQNLCCTQRRLRTRVVGRR